MSNIPASSSWNLHSWKVHNVMCRPRSDLCPVVRENHLNGLCFCSSVSAGLELPGTIKIIRNKIIVRHLARGFAMNIIDEFGPLIY